MSASQRQYTKLTSKGAQRAPLLVTTVNNQRLYYLFPLRIDH